MRACIWEAKGGDRGQATAEFKQSDTGHVVPIRLFHLRQPAVIPTPAFLTVFLLNLCCWRNVRRRDLCANGRHSNIQWTSRFTTGTSACDCLPARPIAIMATTPSNLSAAVTRILSLTGFPKELKTKDIHTAFSEWEAANGGFKIKWIDDTSLYIVFQDATVG
jgi:hypothetical protein